MCGHRFETLLGLLTQPLPPGAPSDLQEASQWTPWKVKKRVAAILHRILQRYGNPSRKADGPDADALIAFATNFQRRCSARALQSSLGVLSSGGVEHGLASPPLLLLPASTPPPLRSLRRPRHGCRRAGPRRHDLPQLCRGVHQV